MTIAGLQENYPALKELPCSIPHYIENNYVFKEFAAGETIYIKHDHIEAIYILLDGIVNIINQFDTGDSICYAQTSAVDVLGEVELLSGETVIASTCIAETPCKTLQLPLRIMQNWLQRDPAMLTFIATSLAKKNYRASYNRGIELFYSPFCLVSAYILNHLTPCPEHLEGIKPRCLQKSRQQMAQDLGISERTVNRAIHLLKEKHLVTIIKKKLFVTREQQERLKESLTTLKAQ